MHHLERTKARHKAPDPLLRKVAEVTEGDQGPALSPQLVTILSQERGHHLDQHQRHQGLRKGRQGRALEHQGEEGRNTYPNPSLEFSFRSGSSDSHHRQGVEKMSSGASGGGHHRKESESSVASGSGQSHPHPGNKKPATKAERRAQQVCRSICFRKVQYIHCTSL